MLADAQRLQGVGVQPLGIFSAAKIIAPRAIDHRLAKMGCSGLAGPQLHAQGQNGQHHPPGAVCAVQKSGRSGHGRAIVRRAVKHRFAIYQTRLI